MTQAISFHTITALLGAGLLSACLQNQTVSEQGVVFGSGLAPAGAAPGTCWGKIPTPAVIETVTEQILVTPAKTNPDGTLASLPVYREESRQQIMTPRTDRWFEIPCPPAFTVEFVSTLDVPIQEKRDDCYAILLPLRAFLTNYYCILGSRAPLISNHVRLDYVRHTPQTSAQSMKP